MQYLRIIGGYEGTFRTSKQEQRLRFKFARLCSQWAKRRGVQCHRNVPEI
jgi:hypothetical protein